MQTKLAGMRSTPVAALLVLSLSACSSSSNSGGNGNSAPIVSAGADQSVLENTLVNLSGSASDADGDTLTYSWTQTAGSPTVTINNANMAAANFMAPDVALGNPAVLTLQLSVSDGTVSRADTVVVTVQEPQPTVTVSGTVNYEFVPPNYVGPPNDCRGLDFGNIQTRPVRGATVQLIDSGSGGVLQTATLSDTGGYSFANVNANSNVRLRVRAELKQQGSPSWDVEVRDNFIAGASDSDIPPPPALGTRALYTLDGTDFNTGSVDVIRDMTATTGWNGASYSGPRAAGPFSILDAIYSGIQFVLTADPTATFAPMDAFWSVNNTLSSPPDITAGELPSSFYTSGLDSLFLLGDANIDTEEFDDHVIMHEWGHYFEDNFSRSDSIGGPHSIGESLDARLAFGEGWATAFAAMTLDDPIYCDSGVVGAMSGFGLDSENDSFGINGWFNEFDVTTLIYDLWDTGIDGTDASSIGFGPIYDTMTGPQPTTAAWTSVFSFATELRSMLNAADQVFLDTQLADENIGNGASLDIWGSNETNDANAGRDVLPVYTDITADGGVTNICTNSDFDSGRDGNNIAEFRYIRLSIPASDTYDVVITTTTATPVTPDPNDRDQSDPDMQLFLNGINMLPFPTGLSPVENSETFTTPTLFAGQTYTADLHEWRFEDTDGAPASYPDQICFDVSFTQTP